MDLSVVYSRALAGITAPEVMVETHLSNGLPAFHIVGLPETAVRESKDRVRSALINSHFDFPDRRITVNLAPADLPKEGGRFDLPIALGILAASGQVPTQSLARHEFVGELALDGTIRPVPGVVCAATTAARAGRQLVLDPNSASRAARVPGIEILVAPDLLSLCAHLNGKVPLPVAPPNTNAEPPVYPDLAEVIGQVGARRALEVAAAGQHSLLLTGPPGTGKSMLASRLPGILPPLSAGDALEQLLLQDVSSSANRRESPGQRPFRCPHHSATAAALAGGGSRPSPGEISLAHTGVLFLDELPEFSRHCLDMLREPLESGEITLSRARYKVTYPARFQLIAAMNPCPCGYLGDDSRHCQCSPEQVQRYRARVSGPLLDRIDIKVAVSRLPAAQLLTAQAAAEPSATVRKRVCQARERQLARHGQANAGLAPGQLVRDCQLAGTAADLLERAANRLNLSGRAVHRTLRVARTIADLAAADSVQCAHISEALGYRD